MSTRAWQHSMVVLVTQSTAPVWLLAIGQAVTQNASHGKGVIRVGGGMNFCLVPSVWGVSDASDLI